MSSILFIPHGGGPLPLLGDPAHRSIIEFLKNLHRNIPKPDAIIVVSAHWEEAIPSVTHKAQPSLYFDYYGFPPQSYQYQYNCPGHPPLAEQVVECLETPCRLDSQRDYDHGLFVPLLLMYPDADIPCIQLSLQQDLDPEQHLAMGEALQTLLAKQNILLLGSGSSFHNISAIQQPDTQAAIAFDDWLKTGCCDPNMQPHERRQRLNNWKRAPGGVYSHPREEHLIPLHLCAGAAGLKPASCIFNADMMGVRVSGFQWAAAKK